MSAVTRAQSQMCKQRIVNVTCLNQQGILYPEKVQSLCPHSPGFTSNPISLGCFKDDKTSRVLSGYYHVFKGNNTLEHCAFICLQSGYPYAGTEYSLVSLTVINIILVVICNLLEMSHEDVILEWNVSVEWMNRHK